MLFKKYVPSIVAGLGTIGLWTMVYFTHKVKDDINKLKFQREVDIEAIDLLSKTLSKKMTDVI